MGVSLVGLSGRGRLSTAPSPGGAGLSGSGSFSALSPGGGGCVAPGASEPCRKGSGDGDVEPDGRTGFPYTGETSPALSTCQRPQESHGNRELLPGEGDSLLDCVYGIRAFSDAKKKKAAKPPTHSKEALAVC